jgi:signal transduction histidine kinase
MHAHGFPNYSDNGNTSNGSKPSVARGNAVERNCEKQARKALASPSGASSAPATSESEEPFAAYLAHELRTPLATQRALLELALADPTADVATWREIGEDVLGACLRQERLLEACLTLAWSRGRALRRDPVDLPAIADAVLREHDRRSLTTMVAFEPARTTGDPSLVERLVANLVSNAIRHNFLGGRIEVTTRTESGRAVISVVNTGPLILAAELRRLFQPFQRLESSSGSWSDGVGLGLAIVQAIADAHSAFVTARARAGGGLEIDVGFPAVEDPAHARRER